MNVLFPINGVSRCLFWEAYLIWEYPGYSHGSKETGWKRLRKILTMYSGVFYCKGLQNIRSV